MNESKDWLAPILGRHGIDPASAPANTGKQTVKVTDASIQALLAQLPNTDAPRQSNLELRLNRIITQDAKMLALKDKIRKLAPLPYSILIWGETGTGKELVAKALHGERKGRFVDLNCGGFPEHLIESELFGHLAGSFTGALKDKQGLFQAAGDGTLFLDEIGELPLLMQTKLLRVLEEKQVRPVGSISNVDVNCRVVAATHCNLGELCDKGKFRRDLLWRLNTVVLSIPALRERAGDIPLLVKHFGIDYDARDFAGNHLEGNVREVKNIITRRKIGI